MDTASGRIDAHRPGPAALRILVIEDEPGIVEFLRAGLTYEGNEVTVAQDGRSGLRLAQSGSFDLAILDLMLPELDGQEVCRALRGGGSDLAIIMLTALRETGDKIAGLDAGADDYLTKPFSFDELLARIRAVRRRRGEAAAALIQVGDLTVDLDAREVRCDSVAIDLTPLEFSLLALFMGHPRRVFSRQTLLNRIWGFDYVGETNAVDVHISHLRRKLGEPHRQWIRTVYGVGYCLRTDDDPLPATV